MSSRRKVFVISWDEVLHLKRRAGGDAREDRRPSIAAGCGIADDLDLQEWLTKYIFPAEAKNVTEDFVRVGTRLGLAEMIRSGTTTYCALCAA